MRRWWPALVLAPGALGTALAADTGLYVGGSIGRSSEHYDASTFDAQGTNTGYKLDAGWRATSLLAVELSYASFGRASAGTNYADTDATGVFAVGFLPIPALDLYGKVGVARWRTDASSPGYSFARTGEDLAYGAGVGLHWGTLGARVEYERYTVSHASDMDLASVGLIWTFL